MVGITNPSEKDVFFGAQATQLIESAMIFDNTTNLATASAIYAQESGAVSSSVRTEKLAAAIQKVLPITHTGNL